MNISVCIATYRRPERLDALLGDLARQRVLPTQVVVVDNDREGSARAVIQRRLADGVPYELVYEIQPERGIAKTRNRTVALATGEWLASIDDDERAPVEWLAQLMQAAERHRADAVLGPVIPVVPEAAAAWIRRGRFYDFPRLQTGSVVPLNRLRFGNVVVRGSLMRDEPGPFDERYGLTTGEDGDLLARLVRKGARIIWDDEAVVHEPVEPARLSLRWLLQRALSGGQEYARKTLAGVYGPVTLRVRAQLLLQSLAQMLIAGLLSAASLPFGRHRAAHWLIRAAANFGKLSVFWGWRYHEYAQVPSS